MKTDFDIRRVFEPINKVLRHLGFETGASTEKMNLPCVFGQKHGRLAGGIGAAHHDNFLASAPSGLELGRCMIDDARKRVLAGDIKSAVAITTCNNDAPAQKDV